MGISLGLVGLGQFGSAFAKLFKSHPLVDRIALCDCEPEKLQKFADDPYFADKLNKKDIFTSLDDICKSDLDALVIITQPWLHAPQCIQAMESGKHVYSAVPVIMVPDGGEVLEWCDRLIKTTKKPDAITCSVKPPYTVRKPCIVERWPLPESLVTLYTPKENTVTMSIRAVRCGKS